MANQEIEAIRAMLAKSPAPQNLTEFRRGYDGFGAMFPLADDIVIHKEKISGFAAEWSKTPEANQDHVILYFHGGGYVIGSLGSHRPLVTELGRMAGTRTLAIDYRLAPESPFPAAIDDALTAYEFLLNQDFNPATIAFAGDSAGGGLAIATMLAARENGLPQPSCALCISPWIDLEMSGDSMATKKESDPMLQPELLSQWAEIYLGMEKGIEKGMGKELARNPLASPLHADLHDLAPLFIQVGSEEILLDDAIRFAERAKAQKLSVQLEVWPEMIHVWHHFYPILSDARKALATAGNFIREHM